MVHVHRFVRGLGFTVLPIGIGLAIARYVPSLWIGIGSIALLLLLIYLAGAAFVFPWERSDYRFPWERQTWPWERRR